MEQTKAKTDIWTILIYLILYSIAGFFIETIFGMITKGVIESRKSFLYGPFCAIYGIGAIAMIVFLKNEKNLVKIFFKGAIIGAVVEYMMSYLCEKYFGVKWWDYSGFLWNIQGRTCLFFAVSWGILAIFLVRLVNPQLDQILKKVKEKKTFKLMILFVISFLVIDAIFSAYALKIFYYRIATENELNVISKNEIKQEYTKIKENGGLAGFVNMYYDNEKMLKNYPNLIIEQQGKHLTYIDNLINNTKPYYYKISKKK